MRWRYDDAHGSRARRSLVVTIAVTTAISCLISLGSGPPASASNPRHGVINLAHAGTQRGEVPRGRDTLADHATFQLGPYCPKVSWGATVLAGSQWAPGVPNANVYSNEHDGNCTNSYTDGSDPYGLKYQSTELAVRWADEYLGIAPAKWGDLKDAKSMWSAATSIKALELSADGSAAPHFGDLLILSDAGTGHVAVIVGVSDGYLYFVGQDQDNAEDRIPIEKGDDLTPAAVSGWLGQNGTALGWIGEMGESSYAPGPTYVTHTIDIGASPQHVAVDPLTDTIYVADYVSDDVAVISGKTDMLTALVYVGCSSPRGIAVDPVTNLIFVACRFSDVVAVINGKSDAVIGGFEVGNEPFDVAVDSVTGMVYVPNADDGTVSVFSESKAKVIATVKVGSSPIGVAVDAKTDRVYVTNNTDGTVSVISGSANTVVATIKVGPEPLDVAVDALTNRVFVTDEGESVWVISGASNGLLTTATVPNSGFHGVAVDPTTGNVYVTDAGENEVTVISEADEAPSFTVPVGTGPWGVGVDVLTDTIYVANIGNPPQNSTVAVIGSPSQQPLDGGPMTAAMMLGGGGFCLACLLKQLLAAAYFGFPVQAEDGNLFDTTDDIQIPGLGEPLAFSRTYNTMTAGTDGPLGYGWTDNLAARLKLSSAKVTFGTTATFTDQVGAQDVFTYTQIGPEGGGLWEAPPRVLATLNQNSNGTWSLVEDGQQTLTFNSSGLLTAVTDLDGEATTYSYTAKNLTKVTDSSGRTLVLAYASGHIVAVTDPNVVPNRAVHFRYNSSGDLVEVKNVNGGAELYSYDSSHRLLSMKTPLCAATKGCEGIRNSYDPQGRVTAQSDDMNRATRFSYSGDPESASGGTTLITDPLGNVTREEFEYGLLVAETKAYGTPQAATTEYEYDPETAQPILEVDPSGRATEMSYDSNGNLLVMTDPLGRTTSYTYNSLNEKLTVTDPMGVTATFTYDSNGNLLSISTPLVGTSDLATTTYVYGDKAEPGEVTSATDPEGHATTYTYDKYGDRTSITDALGDKTTYAYNADGWLLSSVAPKGNLEGCNCAAEYTTTYSYAIPHTKTVNEFGDIETVTDPLGRVTTYGYDADRNRTSITDPDGNVTSYSYDLDDELVGLSRDERPTETMTYNADAKVISQANGAGTVIEKYGYDGLGQETSLTDALGQKTTYSYDAAGNVLTKEEAGGDCTGPSPSGCIAYGYDADNELTSVEYIGSTTPDVSSVSYDADGHRTSMTDGTGTSAWQYDSLGRLISYTNGDGAEVRYGYASLDDRATSITYPGGHVVTNSYNSVGLLESVEDWNGDTSTFTYDANGNVAEDHLANGVVDSYTYDSDNELISIQDRNSHGQVIFAAAYSRGGDGLVSRDGSQPSSHSFYRYTPLDQVCYAASSGTAPCSSPPSHAYSYGYDSAGNLTTTEAAGDIGPETQQFNAAAELCWSVAGTSTNSCSSTPAGATTYVFDSEGNEISSMSAVHKATCYSYNSANQLTAVSTGTGSCAKAQTVATYAYDGDGLRESKTVGGKTTEFLWSGGDAPAELLYQQTSSSTSTYYLFGPEGLPVEEMVGNSPYFYAHDQLGSTRALTNGTGVTEDTWIYDPYGNIVSSTGTVANNLLFGAQYRDAETGLYYLQARYYDSVTGQLLTVDPDVSSTLAAYGYATGDPVNERDPSGLCSWNPFSSDSCEFAAPAQALTAAYNWVSNNKEVVAGVALGVLGAITGVGAIFEGATVLGVLLGVASTLTGALGAGLDAGKCAQGDTVACVGFILGLSSAIGGVFSLIGVAAGVAEGSIGDALLNGLLPGLSLILGGAGSVSDFAYAVFDSSGSCPGE